MSNIEVSTVVKRTGTEPIVFICQNSHKWDETKRAFVPKFDFSAAAQYGSLVELLNPTHAPFNPRPALELLDEKLKHYREGDFLLLIGNPVFIGAATAIAASYNEGKVSVLQWSGTHQRYVPVHLFNL